METVNIYIVETNYLAAQYISTLLNSQPVLMSRVIEITLLDRKLPLDTNHCLLVTDQLFLSSALLSYGNKLKTCFPRSRLVIVGAREFGSRVRRTFPGWLVDVVEYGNVKRLPVAALAAVIRLGGSRLGAAEQTPASRFRLSPQTGLSKRESEIFELVRLQLPNKEIANRLNIAEATVKFHVSNAFAKMGLRRRRELSYS